MSILNVWLEQQTALVGVDSHVFSGDGELVGSTSKMVPLAHLSAALGFRGQFLVFIHLNPAVACHVLDFEALIEQMPALLLQAVTQAGALAQSVSGAPTLSELRGLDAVLVGYSAAKGRMVGYRYMLDEASGTYRAEEIPVEHGFFAPADAEFLDKLEDDVRGLTTEQKLIELAHRQMALARERHPVASTGGHLYLAHVKDGALSIRRACELS